MFQSKPQFKKRTSAAFFLLIFILSSFHITPELSAYWIWSPEQGKFVNSDGQSSDKAEEVYQHALSFQKANQQDRAIEEFENLLRHYSTAAIAPEAQYQVGVTYEAKGEYRLAFEAYKKLLQNYPQSERVAEVVERLFKMGNLFLAGRKERVVGVPVAAGAPKAVEIFEYLVKTAPFSAYGDQALFHLGLAHKEMHDYPKALKDFQKVIDDYPTSTLLDDVRYQLAETSYEFSKFGTRDEHAMDEAIENISDFLKRYPESSVSDKVTKLKQEIAKRDAEKNFRIASYYEKEHEYQSAAFYYEDVVKRYPDSEYGKLATAKLTALKEPLANLHKEERDIALDLDSTSAKLKSLQQERAAAHVGKEPSEREKVLGKEIDELKQKESSLFLQQKKGVKDREKALIADEKAWREKWKALAAKRKEMKQNRAPELAVAFERWEKSLLTEKEKLAKERKTVEGLRGATKKSKQTEEVEQPPTEPKKNVAPPAGNVPYGLKDLAKARTEREEVLNKYNATEKEFIQLTADLSELDRQGFELARSQKWFQQILQVDRKDLKAQADKLAAERAKLNESIHEFESKKAEHEKQYGPEGLENLTLDKPVANLNTSKEFEASGVSLENSLTQLKNDKAKLGDSWTAQKQVVESISVLFEADSKQPAVENPDLTEDMVKKEEIAKAQSQFESLDSRTLRKRIKFIEREIRNRFDEIEDWNAQKREALKTLDLLMHGRERQSIPSKIIGPVTAPVRFMWWLMHSVAFGLSDEDKKLMKQADRAKKSMAADEAEQVRKLQEEIQLESLLMQGRYEEIQTMEIELAALRNIAESRNIHLVPILLEKDFTIGEESLRSAGRMVPEQNREEILIQRLNNETQKLSVIENNINQIDQKMTEIDQVIEQRAAEKAKADAAEKQKEKEDKTEDVEQKSTNQDAKKESLASLTALKSQIESGEQSYQTSKEVLDHELFSFYQTIYAKQPKDALSEGEIAVYKKQDALDKKHKELEAVMLSQKNSEVKLLLTEKDILENHTKHLQKKLDRLKKKKESPEYQAVSSDIDSMHMELNAVQEMLGHRQVQKES